MVNNNILYLVIGVLLVAVCIFAYQRYEEAKKPQGLQITIGPNGASVESK